MYESDQGFLYAPANAEEDAKWREVPDPEEPKVHWRCRALQLEFRWLTGDYGFLTKRWFQLAQFRDGTGVTRATPERKAVWLDLFTNP